MGNDWLGPVEHLDIRVAPGGSPAEGLHRLRALVDGGVVRLLDLEVVVGADGDRQAVDVGTWGDGMGLDLHAFDGAWSGLLDDDDLAMALPDLDDGAVEIVVVYEVVAIAALLDAFDGPAVHVTGSGPVAEADLLAALERGELAGTGAPA